MLKHLITGEELSLSEIQFLLNLSTKLKKTRGSEDNHALLNKKNLALIFEKNSLRTRFSFTIAVKELGGATIESISGTRKKEEPEDLVRVLAGYCDGIIIRTSDDDQLLRMEKVTTIPIINALTDDYHPCQILADFLTLKEVFGKLEGLKLTYVGDGNNILHSLLLMAPLMGIHLHYCCPKTREPKKEILTKAEKKASTSNGSITSHVLPTDAVENAHAIYTDVWESMGFTSVDEKLFNGFQVNEKLMSLALDHAVFMHCMPMIRGKEVSKDLPDSKASVVFQQSENRLHVQKALLLNILG